MLLTNGAIYGILRSTSPKKLTCRLFASMMLHPFSNGCGNHV
jgi:hypothetical protein